MSTRPLPAPLCSEIIAPTTVGWSLTVNNGIPSTGAGGQGRVTAPVFSLVTSVKPPPDRYDPDAPPPVQPPGNCGQCLGTPGASSGLKYFELLPAWNIESDIVATGFIACGLSPVLPAAFFGSNRGTNFATAPGNGTIATADGNIEYGQGSNFQTFNGFGHGQVIRFAVNFSAAQVWVGVAIFNSKFWYPGVPSTVAGYPLNGAGTFYPCGAIYMPNNVATMNIYLQASTFQYGTSDIPSFSAWAAG